MKKVITVLAVLTLLVLTNVSFSQITASLNTKGSVLSPISVSSTVDLNFGTSILPGRPVTIDKTSVSAGQFNLAGAAGKQIAVTLTLPTNLVSSGNNLAISFAATDGGWKTPTGSWNVFNPASATNATFATEGTMIVAIGGTVSPTYTQVAGNYTATASISMVYTGN